MLLHPVAIAALVVLVVNDHVLKSVARSGLTGKLSDLAGLVVFPLLLATLVELVRPRTDRRALVLASIAITAAGFGLAKTTDLGASLFGWSLGVSQFVTTLGPLRGAALAPASVIADPTDLLALPAVLVAAWIAIPRTHSVRPVMVRSRPSAATLTVLVVAGLASMATSKGQPTVSTDFEAELHLTKASPVAVRHLDFTVTPGTDHIESVTFIADASEHAKADGSEYLEPSVNARLSIIPDETDTDLPADWRYLGQGIDLTQLCASGCKHGVTLVVRLAPDAPDSLDVVLSASVIASDGYREGDDQSMDTAISLIENVDARIDGSPPSLLATVSGTIEVGTNQPDARSTITLTVDKAALKGTLAFPLVGRMTVNMVSDAASGHPYANRIELSWRDDEEPIYLSGDAVPMDLDWLSRCQTGTDCTVTLDINSSYEAWLNAPESDESDPDAEPTESTPGFVRMAWTVDVILEAFDGRRLPANALVLTKD